MSKAIDGVVSVEELRELAAEWFAMLHERCDDARRQFAASIESSDLDVATREAVVEAFGNQLNYALAIAKRQLVEELVTMPRCDEHGKPLDRER